jgi:hypothetical protein
VASVLAKIEEDERAAGASRSPSAAKATRRSIPNKVQNVLWGRASGRCQYAGCNRLLLGEQISGARNANKAPSGEQWLHKIKFDGYRVQVHLNKGKKRVFTRNGLDWTKRFSVIAGALDIPGQAILDGEAVVVHEGPPTSPNCRPNSPRADRTGWSTTRSTCSGGTAISGNFLRWSASECSPTYSTMADHLAQVLHCLIKSVACPMEDSLETDSRGRYRQLTGRLQATMV